MKRLILILLLAALAAFGGSIDTDKLADLVGYTIVAATHVDRSFEGADYDKPVLLGNGWLFKFSSYHYHYAYHPSAIVLAKLTTADELRKMGIKPVSEQPIATHKLIIDDDVYDVNRVR
jgi:hypothetical protein